MTRPKSRPAHYKVVCISLYTRDVELLGELVRRLKARGFTKANRSMVIRLALAQLDVDTTAKKLSLEAGEPATAPVTP